MALAKKELLRKKLSLKIRHQYKTTIFKGKHDVPESVLIEQTLINNW